MDFATPSRRQFLSAVLASATAGLAGCALPGPQESNRETRSLDAASGAPLSVRNVNGDVVVTDGATDGIELEIVKRTNFGRDLLDRVSVDVETGDEETTVTTRTEDLPVGASVSVRLELSLPEGVPIGRIETQNGSVIARDISGDGRLVTTNGRIEADRIAGYLSLQTSNGSIEARDVDGIDAAQTSNGSLDVDVAAIRQDTRLRSTNGSVTVNVAEDLDAVIDLRTTNGDVSYSGLDLSVSTDRETHLRGTLGDGGIELSAETTNGDVRLRRL